MPRRSRPCCAVSTPVEISPLRRLKNPHPKTLHSAPFPHISQVLRNGPEQARARGFCAAQRTLAGEDRSATYPVREKGQFVRRPLFLLAETDRPCADPSAGNSRRGC